MGGSTMSSTNDARQTGYEQVEVGSPGAGVIRGCENTGMLTSYLFIHTQKPTPNEPKTPAWNSKC